MREAPTVNHWGRCCVWERFMGPASRETTNGWFVPWPVIWGHDPEFQGIRVHVPRLPWRVPHFPFIPVGNGLNRRTLVYDKDVGHAAALAVSHPAAAGRVFNVTDGGFHTLNEIIESICSALGRKPPRLSLPVGPARIAAGLIETGYRLMGIMGTRSRILANSGHVPIIPPITKAIIDKYTEDIAVDGSLIKRELGFVPEYDLKTGWEETIREMQGKTKC
jgi:nucleoside-diphosphate-sugar epimerase